MKTYQHQIENAAHRVFYALGEGQDKLAYQMAFIAYLEEDGLSIHNDKINSKFYDKIQIPKFKPDLCINQEVVIQLINKEKFKIEEEWEFVNYLTNLRLEVGYIINFKFGTDIKIKYRRDRIIIIN